MPYEIHVISNTHWDREWLFDFQETRMQLIELFDALLDILDERPDYRAFLMDAQAVPVEDYLEVRPEQRERLAAHVAAGRIQIGPWYTNPECFSVGGESLVRNLAYGHRVAREHGGVMKAGYTPFSYGQNSQMPQIYRGFGIDTMLFYHGVSHTEVPNEFWFEGADGSRVLGSQLSSGARYNFYHHVYRPAKFGRGIDDRMREWADGGCPFHHCDGDRFREHHWRLDPNMGFDREAAVACVRKLMEAEKAVCITRVLAFFMGHDSSIPDTLTLAIIDEARPRLGEDTIAHASLPEHLDKVKAALPDGLPVLKGERRTPKPMPLIYHLYCDVLSSRTRMKRKNALAETMLQRWAEPFAALAWTLGAPYPRALLDLAWKTLLRGHPHDSIAGSGVDDIEEDMHHRLRQVQHRQGTPAPRAGACAGANRQRGLRPGRRARHRVQPLAPPALGSGERGHRPAGIDSRERIRRRGRGHGRIRRGAGAHAPAAPRHHEPDGRRHGHDAVSAVRGALRRRRARPGLRHLPDRPEGRVPARAASRGREPHGERAPPCRYRA
jgi:hypothetical protein